MRSSEAVCATVDPDMWFPSEPTNIFSPVYKVCTSCPVQRECLKFSFDNREEFGVWGGVSETQRGRLLATYHKRTLEGRSRMIDRLLSERNEQIFSAWDGVEENRERNLERKRVKDRERRKERLDAA